MSVYEDGDSVPTDWLRQRLSQEQVEAEIGPDSSLWRELEPGDEVWGYSSPPDSWRHLAGRAGLAVVRNGRVIRSVLTLMN